MNVHQILEFLVTIGETNKAEDVTRQLEGLLASYSFDFYGLSLQLKAPREKKNSLLAGRLPKGWREAYRYKKYALIDPVARMLVLTHRPFRLRDAITLPRTDPKRIRVDRMVQDAARHGVTDGYAFPVHGRTGILGSMIVGGRRVDLSPIEMAMFDLVAKTAMWRFLDVRGSATELEPSGFLDIPLTRREIDVISHLADGLTSPEIARSLEISSHTVDWYIQELQDKLKARNRQHVVALALRNGLVI